MDPERERAQVTELFVRMDCNGCVQRIKRAMHTLDDVYEVYIDVARQKLTVVGRADPQRIVKAIKKTRKTAIICSHTEATEPSSSGPPPAEQAAAPESANQVPAETAPPLDPTKDDPAAESEEADPPKPKDEDEIYMVHHYPHDSIHGGHWNVHPMGHDIRHEASPYYVTHGYNSFRSSPSITEYAHIRSPRQRPEFCGDGSHHSRLNGYGGQVTSLFSEENPNACRIT